MKPSDNLAAKGKTMKKVYGVLVIALVGLGLTGCEEVGGASAERITALETELGTLRDEFGTFREEWAGFHEDWGVYREQIGLGEAGTEVEGGE
jgi:hypothetical protein